MIEDMDGIRYINAGDWVESCTAVVEDFDGAFSIVPWPHVRHQEPQLQPALDHQRQAALTAQPQKFARRRRDHRTRIGMRRLTVLFQKKRTVEIDELRRPGPATTPAPWPATCRPWSRP